MNAGYTDIPALQYAIVSIRSQCIDLLMSLFFSGSTRALEAAEGRLSQVGDSFVSD